MKIHIYVLLIGFALIQSSCMLITQVAQLIPFAFIGSVGGNNIDTPSIAEEMPKEEIYTNDKCAYLEAARMNVFYIGLDNPVRVYASGIPSGEVKITATNAIIKQGNGIGTYTVRTTRPGEVVLSIRHKDKTYGKYKFRSKRIPDPKARIGKSSGGAIGMGEFETQQGVFAILENFDFDAKCKILGFELTQIERDGTISNTINRGGPYSGESLRLIRAAKPGDIFLYERVKAKCPGDLASRLINSMIFRIK